MDNGKQIIIAGHLIQYSWLNDFDLEIQEMDNHYNHVKSLVIDGFMEGLLVEDYSDTDVQTGWWKRI